LDNKTTDGNEKISSNLNSSQEFGTDFQKEFETEKYEENEWDEEI